MKTKFNPSNLELQPYIPRIVALGLLATVLLLILTGCQRSASPRAAKLNPAGVYPLMSVDGKAVPCDVTHEGAAMHFQSGTFTITADGTCTSAMTNSVANRQNLNVVTHAAWTIQGAELTMQWEGAGTTLGRVNGNTFTMTNEGMVFAYQK